MLQSSGVCKRVMLRGGMFRRDRQKDEGGGEQQRDTGRTIEKGLVEREGEIWD